MVLGQDDSYTVGHIMLGTMATFLMLYVLVVNHYVLRIKFPLVSKIWLAAGLFGQMNKCVSSILNAETGLAAEYPWVTVICLSSVMFGLHSFVWLNVAWNKGVQDVPRSKLLLSKIAPGFFIFTLVFFIVGELASFSAARYWTLITAQINLFLFVVSSVYVGSQYRAGKFDYAENSTMLAHLTPEERKIVTDRAMLAFMICNVVGYCFFIPSSFFSYQLGFMLGFTGMFFHAAWTFGSFVVGQFAPLVSPFVEPSSKKELKSLQDKNDSVEV